MYLPAKAEKEVIERSEEPESGSNMGMMIAIIAIAGVGGAAYYYFKFIRGKKNKDEDLDFYDDEDYQEEPYVNEDTEPEFAEDDSNIPQSRKTRIKTHKDMKTAPHFTMRDSDCRKTPGRCRRGRSPSDFHSYPTALPAGRVVDFACKINSLQIRATSG